MPRTAATLPVGTTFAPSGTMKFSQRLERGVFEAPWLAPDSGIMYVVIDRNGHERCRLNCPIAIEGHEVFDELWALLDLIDPVKRP